MSKGKPPAVDPTPENFDDLCHFFAQTRWRWRLWKTLWMPSEPMLVDGRSQWDLMGTFAPHFFGTVKRLLVEAVIADCCKMTDPHQHGSKEHARNVSLHLFVEKNPCNVSDDAINDARAMLKSLEVPSEALRKYRNWIISHIDLAIVQGAKDIPDVRDDLIELVLGQLEDVIHALNPDVPRYRFDKVYGKSTGADVLLMLERAAKGNR